MRKNRSVILVLLFVIGVCGTAWIIYVDPGVATACAVIVATVALWVNYILNKRRVAFDSLLKLAEVFHIQLKEDRDNVVDLKIKDGGALEAFLTKVQAADEKAIKEKRSINRVLNFYALMGMMIQDKYLCSDIGIKYFGAAICHKAEDWTAYLDHLKKDDNYKGMISEVNYVCGLAGTS
ncbi:MAG: hypothetical protein KAV87_35280 [Desulfobacteraceae bacterium]|nr:hypothetical protein [Desulfobacteraceae bacterium]